MTSFLLDLSLKVTLPSISSRSPSFLRGFVSSEDSNDMTGSLCTDKATLCTDDNDDASL